MMDKLHLKIKPNGIITKFWKTLDSKQESDIILTKDELQSKLEYLKPVYIENFNSNTEIVQRAKNGYIVREICSISGLENFYVYSTTEELLDRYKI